MKDETIVLSVSSIEEPLVTNTTPLSEEKEEVKPETDLSKAAYWVVKMQSVKGLLESSENTDFVSLYDYAMAALVFMQLNEMDGAEKIFDYFNGQVNNELLSTEGGFYQYRDGNGENRNRKRTINDCLYGL